MRTRWVNTLRYAAAATVLLVGVSSSFYGGHLVREWHRSMIAASFSHLMELYVHSIDASLARGTEDLRALGDYMAATGRLQRPEFTLFTASLLSRYPALERVLWVPRLDGESLSHLDTLRATVLDKAKGSEADVPERDTPVWPVQLVLPDEGGEQWLGLDARQHPLFEESLKKARAATEPVSSYAFARDGGKLRDGFMIAVNVPNAVAVNIAGDGSVMADGGFIVGLVSTPELIRRAMDEFVEGFIKVYLLDSTGHLLGQYGVERPPPGWEPGTDITALLGDVPVRSQRLAVADREWQLVGQPGAAFAPPRSPREATAVVVAGSVLSMLLALYLVSLTGETIRRRQMIDKLQNVVKYDYLTGLHTRSEFFRVLGDEWERAERHRHELSVVMLDLDQFKAINDRYGHASGDIVLSEVGQAIAHHVRAADRAARYGGEEFVLMLVETGLHEAHKLAERIQKEIRGLRISVDGNTSIRVAATFGIAEMTSETGDFQELIDRADRALYQGKSAGRDTIKRFESEPGCESDSVPSS